MKSLLVVSFAFCLPSLLVLHTKADPFPENNSGFELSVKVIIGALVGAIGAMAAWFKASHRRLEKALDERDKQRDRLWARIAKLTGITKMLARCPGAHCPYKEVTLDGEETQRLDRD